MRTENGIRYGDTIDHVDFAYLAKMTKLNVGALAAIASAPPPPAPKVEGAVSTDTTVTWTGSDSVAYKIWWRRTDASNWQISRTVQVSDRACKTVPISFANGRKLALQDCKAVIPHVRVDDWVFGVSSVSKDGFESPVASAVPGGAYSPIMFPPPITVKK